MRREDTGYWLLSPGSYHLSADRSGYRICIYETSCNEMQATWENLLSVIHHLLFNGFGYLTPLVLLVAQLWFKAGFPDGLLNGG